jgi:4-hydroxy-tetrahydrodipicolinate synthase
MKNIRKTVHGPVIPLPTPFTKEFEVDYDSLFRYVEFLVENGIKNVMTTVGTSRFNLLTDDEVKKVNETVVKAAAGKAITIVANPTTGGTRQAIDFAKHAEQIGADFFLAYYPERFYGDDNTYDYFKSINDAVNIGILIHEMPARNGYGPGTIQYSIALLDKLLGLNNILGFKEEALDAEHSNKIVARYKDTAVIIGAGGGMSRYLLRDHKLGSKAFLGGIGNFIPQLELDFFEAITSGNQSLAEKIVNEIELPYFTKVVPVGWHPSLKAALSLMNLMPAYERPPMKQYSETQVDVVRQALRSNNWLKDKATNS